MKKIHNHEPNKFFELTFIEYFEADTYLRDLEANKIKFCSNTFYNTLKDIERLKEDLKEQGYNFYKPTKDHTGKIFLMRYCNNNFSYGIEVIEKKVNFHLCNSNTLSSDILEIYSTHTTFEELKKEFSKQKAIIKGY